MVSWEVLTKAIGEGGGRSHRLLAVLYDGTCDQVATGAEEAEVVSAHCCCADLGRSGGRAAQVNKVKRRGGAEGMHLTEHPVNISRLNHKRVLERTLGMSFLLSIRCDISMHKVHP